MVDVSSATGASTAVLKSDKAKASLGADYDSFLKLLTTQLKNQDPTAPMDANQFTQQMVSFTGVEQAINTNTNLEKLISLNQTTQLNNAASYIGKVVEADGSAGQLINGQAQFSYSLPKATAETTITITDSTGKVVFTGPGEKAEGQYKYVWDGKDVNGNQAKSGSYNIAVTAKDKNQSAVTATTTTTGMVLAITIESGMPMLTLSNGTTVSLDTVKGITNPVAAATKA